MTSSASASRRYHAGVRRFHMQWHTLRSELNYIHDVCACGLYHSLFAANMACSPHARKNIDVACFILLPSHSEVRRGPARKDQCHPHGPRFPSCGPQRLCVSPVRFVSILLAYFCSCRCPCLCLCCCLSVCLHDNFDSITVTLLQKQFHNLIAIMSLQSYLTSNSSQAENTS